MRKALPRSPIRDGRKDHKIIARFSFFLIVSPETAHIDCFCVLSDTLLEGWAFASVQLLLQSTQLDDPERNSTTNSVASTLNAVTMARLL